MDISVSDLGEGGISIAGQDIGNLPEGFQEVSSCFLPQKLPA